MKRQLVKSYIFLKRTPKSIKTNVFNICVVHLWFKNKDIQFILYPYVVTTYYTSYMTKINQSITSKLHFIIKKCITNNIDVNIKIQKLGNVFLDAQQMIAQLVVYLMFPLPLVGARDLRPLSSRFVFCFFLWNFGGNKTKQKRQSRHIYRIRSWRSPKKIQSRIL